MKAYTLMKNITGRRGTSDADWAAFKVFGKEAKNGLPASGRKLLNAAPGDRDGNKARDRYNHLILDSLKKDRETDTKGGLKSAARKREQAENDSEDESAPTRALTPLVTIRAVIVTPDRRQDMNRAVAGQLC